MTKHRNDEAYTAPTEPNSAVAISTPGPDALRVDEAARRLNVSERTIRRLVKNGELRVIRLIRTLLIPRAEIDRILDVRGESKSNRKGGSRE